MKISKTIIKVGIGGILLLGGLFAIYFGYYGQSFGSPTPPAPLSTTNLPAVAQPTPSTNGQTSQAPQGSGIPVTISVPDVNINLGVKPGYYNPVTKKWTLSSDSAFFAMISVKPNADAGNTYIYGHNRSSVFNRLGKVHVGSIATITTDSGVTYTYRYKYQIVANPNDSTVLSFGGSPRLTLQTCSGAFFQNRSLYVFDLVGVSHA